MARKPTMAELQKTSLVKYFASLSLKLGVSFVGGCSAYRWNCWWSWQASPGVPSLDTAGVRERAIGGPGGRLIWKMSVGSFSDSDTPPHPGYHRRLEANEGCVQDISCSLKNYAYFFYSHED